MNALTKIVEAVEARLAAIDNADLNLGGRIYRGRESFNAEHDTFPLATVHSGGWHRNDDANSLSVRVAEISVSMLARADQDSPIESELAMVEALEAALYPPAKRVDGRDDLDGTALWLEVDGCVILARQDGGKLCEVRIDLLVNYQEPGPCS